MKTVLGLSAINRTTMILAIVCGLMSASLSHFKLLDQWNYAIQDYIFSKPSSKEIVVIAIDDKSIQHIGRWPWSTALHANLINQLSEARVRAIALDVLFMKADLSDPNNDNKLALAIQNNGNVVLPTLIERHENRQISIIQPLSILSQAAYKLTATRINFDSRGIVNGIHLNITDDQQTYPNLALGLLSAASQHTFSLIQSNLPHIIPFADSLNDFQQYSYVDILGNPALLKTLENKFIIVSVTASGLSQNFTTPISKNYELTTGAELTVKMLANLLNQKIVQPLNPIATYLLTFLFVFMPLISYGFVSTQKSLVILLSSLAINLCITLFLLTNFQLWYPPLGVSFILILSYSLWSNFRQELISQALSTEKNQTQATLQSIGDGVITTNTQGIITFLNPAAELITGFATTDASGKKFKDVVKLKKSYDLFPILHAIKTNQTYTTSTFHYLINKQGKEYAIRFSVNPVHQENKTSSTVVALSDITEIINVNQQMLHLATHDALTNLPNRILLREKIVEAIDKCVSTDQQLSILFIDLDGFKKINDGLGHAVGDELLIEIAKRLSHCVTQSGIAARWGGDEFILLLSQIKDRQQIHQVTNDIIKQVGKAVVVNKQELFVTPSIGISCFPKDGDNVDTLLDKADAAMYKVKEMGRNNYHFYNQNLSSEAKHRLTLEREMHYALKNDQFEMYYQLQVDLITERIIGVESLIRWRHPNKGLISPDEFIPLAEEIGLIVPIGHWIIKKVCQQLSLWQAMDIPPIYAAINISARQFMEKDLVEIIRENLYLYQLQSQNIHIEITESMMLTHLNHVEETLEQLKAMGMTIAIDDFGTGYSSLSFLKRFSIDILKIDRSFVHNIFINNDDSSIISAVSSLAHSMNMTLIAEGIENPQQYSLLKQLGCHIGQGYFFSKPITAKAMTRLLQSSNGVFQRPTLINLKQRF